MDCSSEYQGRKHTYTHTKLKNIDGLSWGPHTVQRCSTDNEPPSPLLEKTAILTDEKWVCPATLPGHAKHCNQSSLRDQDALFHVLSSYQRLSHGLPPLLELPRSPCGNETWLGWNHTQQGPRMEGWIRRWETSVPSAEACHHFLLVMLCFCIFWIFRDISLCGCQHEMQQCISHTMI